MRIFSWAETKDHGLQQLQSLMLFAKEHSAKVNYKL